MSIISLLAINKCTVPFLARTTRFKLPHQTLSLSHTPGGGLLPNTSHESTPFSLIAQQFAFDDDILLINERHVILFYPFTVTFKVNELP